MLTDIDAPQAVTQPGHFNRDYARGDADQAIRRASVVTDLQFSIARNNHNPMELPATIAKWDMATLGLPAWISEKLTVWDKVQSISSARQVYAHAMGVPQGNVRVISPFVGGAFGSAVEAWPHQLLAAFAARRMQRPVKLVLTRKQMYSAIGYRPTSRQRMAIGADHSGHLVAMIHEGRTETAKYGTYEDGLVGNPRFLYRVPDMRSTYRVVPLDVNLPTYMRGPGAVSGMFALESGMDDLAHRLGMDPIELRLRNEPDVDQTDGRPFSTRRLTDCLRQGAATFGWNRRNPTPGATHDGDQLVGIGMAAAAFFTARSQCAAIARVLADGTAEVQSGTSDMGPGTYTSMTQVAADALGMPVIRVRFALGDSRFPPAPPHSGSQTMASVGSAVFTAANMLRDRFIRTAITDPESPLNGLRPQDVAVILHNLQGRTRARRVVPGSVAPTRLAPSGLRADVDAQRRRQALLDVRLRSRIRRSRRGPTACDSADPPHLWVLRRGPGDQSQTRAQSGDRRHGRRHWDGPVGRDPTRPP